MRHGIRAPGIERRRRAVIDLSRRRFVRYPRDGRALVRRRRLDGRKDGWGGVVDWRRRCAIARNDGVEFAVLFNTHARRYQDLLLTVLLDVRVRRDDDFVFAVLIDEDVPRLYQLRLSVFLDELRCGSCCESRDAAGVRRKWRENHVIERIFDIVLDVVFYSFRDFELLAYPFVQGLARARTNESDALKSVPCLKSLKGAAC